MERILCPIIFLRIEPLRSPKMAAHPKVLFAFCSILTVFGLNVPRMPSFALLPYGVLCGGRANTNLSRAEQHTAAASHHCASPFCSFLIAPSPNSNQSQTYVLAALYEL
jgi:hypothetical protein